ncbi:MAG: hypothetical protein R3B90_13805 [Planctomycetaceae bacterium]
MNFAYSASAESTRHRAVHWLVSGHPRPIPLVSRTLLAALASGTLLLGLTPLLLIAPAAWNGLTSLRNRWVLG